MSICVYVEIHRVFLFKYKKTPSQLQLGVRIWKLKIKFGLFRISVFRP